MVRRSKTSSSDFVSSLHFTRTRRSLSSRASRRRTPSSNLSLNDIEAGLTWLRALPELVWKFETVVATDLRDLVIQLGMFGSRHESVNLSPEACLEAIAKS